MTTENTAAGAANGDARPEKADKTTSGGEEQNPTEARARRMGWIPADEWDDSSMKNRPKEFLPADEYIEKVEASLPIMRERERRRRAEKRA